MTASWQNEDTSGGSESRCNGLWEREEVCDKELKRKEKGKLATRSEGGTERAKNSWTRRT